MVLVGHMSKDFSTNILYLLVWGVDQNSLARFEIRSASVPVERGVVPVTTPTHLRNYCLVPVVQRRQPTDPTFRFRMFLVSFFAQCDNVPESMQLTVLAQEVLSA